MKLRIVYRSYGGENRKDRPAFYSKKLALESMLRAAERAGAEIVFVNDGPVPEERLARMREAGEVVTLPGVGMRGSYVAALRLPDRFGWPDDDLVWFSEDDYLYAPDAFVRLVAAATQLPAQYFALYGGTQRYPVAPGVEDVVSPRGWSPGPPVVVDGQSWSRALSTASTFGVGVAALRADLPIFLQGLLPHRTMLRDHDTAVVYQGFEPHRWGGLARDLVGASGAPLRARVREAALVPFKAALNLRSHRRATRRRVLLAAEPNLATHLEIAQLAPGRDWSAVARETAEWASARAPRREPVALPAIRVLVVENSLRDNGGLRVSLENTRRWAASGVPARVAVVQDVADAPLATPDTGADVVMLARRGSRFRTTWPAALARLTVLARRSGVVVCGSEIGFGLLLAYAAARLARRPFAVLVQGDLDEAIATWLPRPLRRPTRWVHRHADAAVCVAENLVAGVVANGLPASRAHVVPNGIDVAAIRARAGLSPGGAHPPVRADAGVPVILGLGRLSPQKDFAALVSASAQVTAAAVPHRLVIVGDGPERPRLEALISELDAADTVELAGHAENPYPLLAAADLVVLPSRSEGMPLVLIEALALGRPIIATRSGTGTELLLGGGEYGELVPVGSVDALAAAIEKHLRDPSALRERAARGPRRALGFDGATSARATYDVLVDLAVASAGMSRTALSR